MTFNIYLKVKERDVVRDDLGESGDDANDDEQLSVGRAGHDEHRRPVHHTTATNEEN